MNHSEPRAVTAHTQPPLPRAQRALVQPVLEGTLVGLAAMLVGVVMLGLWWLPASSDRLLRHTSEQLAGQQAAAVEQQLKQLEQRLQAVADPGLIDALEQRHAAELAAWQHRLEHHFPEAVSVRLLPLGPLGIAGLRREDSGLRNNIEMDLLRHASTGQPAGPEAYRIDGRWLVSMAHPLTSSAGDYSAGAVLLTLPASLFQGLDSRAAGQTTLVQTLAGGPQAFARDGTAEPGATVVEQALSVDHWRLHFAPSPQLVSSHRLENAPLWLLAGLAAAGLLGGALLTAHRLRRLLARNIEALRRADPAAVTLPGLAELLPQVRPETAPDTAAAAPVPAEIADQDEPEPPPSEDPGQTIMEVDFLELPDRVFRAYDVRGRADTDLTPALVHQLGLAIGSEAEARGQKTLVVGRDGRETSPALARALIAGLQESGREVVDVGMVPTPLLYFAAHQLGTLAGVMVTASHNPREYNGLKIMLGGRPVAGDAIQDLRRRIEEQDFIRGQGSHRHHEGIIETYIDTIVSDVAIAQPLKLVLDAGNAVAGAVAPRLFQALGCEVVPLYCEVDGSFPNHHPDPTVAANLKDLVAAVREHEADLGLGFDGDGDRLGVVTASGRMVQADELLMVLAQDVVARNPGTDILYDVKCSRRINALVSQLGGRPIMWLSGHSHMKEKMLDTGALLGGEFSGHIYFNERWYGFDDALYAGARLVEILSTGDPSMDNLLAALPPAVATPELRLPLAESDALELVRKLVENGDWGEGKVTTLDGLRVDYSEGWGLIRASNTEPALTLRFEANDDDALEHIRQLFRQQLASIDAEVAGRF